MSQNNHNHVQKTIWIFSTTISKAFLQAVTVKTSQKKIVTNTAQNEPFSSNLARIFKSPPVALILALSKDNSLRIGLLVRMEVFTPTKFALKLYKITIFTISKIILDVPKMNIFVEEQKMAQNYVSPTVKNALSTPFHLHPQPMKICSNSKILKFQEHSRKFISPEKPIPIQ